MEKEELKCVITTPTGQCVMTDGTKVMQEWSADSWDSILKVNTAIIIST